MNKKESKFKVGDSVYIVHGIYVPDKIPCPACETPGIGKVQLKDGKWYDCPNCNLIKEDWDGFDIRDSEMIGYVKLDTGKTNWTINQRKVVQVQISKSIRGYPIYILDDNTQISENTNIFSTREEAEEYTNTIKNKKEN